MKIIKLLLNAILIVSFLCGCSKNIDKKEDAPTKTEENKKEDNKVNRQENNPNDKNNINNNEVINKTQDGEKSPNNETSQVKETPKETNRKVRLNVTPQVQKVWYYCAPTSVSMILSYRGVYVDQFTLAKEMGTYEPFGTHNKDAIRVLNKYMFGYEFPVTGQAGYRLEAVVGGTQSAQEILLFKQRLKKNIKDGYPMYLTMDVSKIYPGLKGEHNVTAIGYIETEDGSDIKYVYYLDPAPKVQDSVYGGLKIETPEKLLNSMLTCEEPNYAW